MDRDLVEAAQNGDREAYVDLIRARSDRLFAIAQRILRDIDRAEDALQDALVIAWRDLRGLRDPDRFDAWLQRLLINVCIAQATRERRRTANLRVCRSTDRPRPMTSSAWPTGTCSSAASDGCRPNSGRSSSSTTTSGYAPSEIAETLGIPAGTARSRLHHAHRAMRAALDADARTTVPEGRLGMNQQRDIERLLDHWLADGPTAVADRVIDVVADRIERQSPATRVAPPLEAHPREHQSQARRRARRGHRHRGRRRLRPACRRPSTGVGGPAPRRPSASPRSPSPSTAPSASAVFPAVVHAASADGAGILPAGSQTTRRSRRLHVHRPGGLGQRR